MKKLNKITLGLASLAFAAAALVGCADNNPDREPQVNLTTFYLRGNMNNWANDKIADGALTANGDGTYSITYTAKAADDEFAIADEKWTVKFCDGTSVAVDGDNTELASGGKNAKVTGQIPGNNYKMTIQPLSSSVIVKVELAGANVQTFYFDDENDGLQAFSYDGSKYTRSFTASADGTSELVIFSEGKYYYSETAISGFKKEVTLKTAESKKTTTTPALTSNVSYKVIVTPDKDGETYTLAISENLIDISDGDFIGDANGDGIPFSEAEYNEAKNSWTFDVEYKNSMNAWGGGNGKLHFKIRKVAGDWSGGDYGFSGFVEGSLPTGVTFIEDDTNPTLSGLSEKTYLIEFVGNAANFTINVTEK